MKINEIITEDLIGDMVAKDLDYNPKHLEYIQKQARRQDHLNKTFTGTPVFTKPVRKAGKSFSTIPDNDVPKSAGYVGNVDAQVRTKHISDEEGKKLSAID